MGAFRGGGERRGGGVGRLIEGGGVGRLDGKNLQILDLHRLASLHFHSHFPDFLTVFENVVNVPKCNSVIPRPHL